MVTTMYRAESGGSTPPLPRPECSTNCVLTVTSVKMCEASVLLLEQVHRLEAMESVNDLKNESPDSCAIFAECCDLSRSLPPTCFEGK